MILMFYTTLGKGERPQWMERGYRGSERQTEREMRLFMCVYNQFGQSKLRVFLFFSSWTPTINQSKLDSPGSSHSAEETSLLLCLSSRSPSRSPLVSSTLANETVTDWQGKKGHRSEVVLTSWPDRWTPLRISWRTHPLSPGTRRQSRPSRPPRLSPGGSSPRRRSSPRSGSGTGSAGGGRDKREEVECCQHKLQGHFRTRSPVVLLASGD